MLIFAGNCSRVKKEKSVILWGEIAQEKMVATQYDSWMNI